GHGLADHGRERIGCAARVTTSTSRGPGSFLVSSTLSSVLRKTPRTFEAAENFLKEKQNWSAVEAARFREYGLDRRQTWTRPVVDRVDHTHARFAQQRHGAVVGRVAHQRRVQRRCHEYGRVATNRLGGDREGQ